MHRRGDARTFRLENRHCAREDRAGAGKIKKSRRVLSLIGRFAALTHSYWQLAAADCNLSLCSQAVTAQKLFAEAQEAQRIRKERALTRLKEASAPELLDIDLPLLQDCLEEGEAAGEDYDSLPRSIYLFFPA